MQTIDLTVGLVTRNEGSMIEDFLSDLSQVTKNNIKNLIIADNNSTDDTLNRILSWQKINPLLNLEVLCLNENNMAKARNAIIDHSETKWLYFIDTDCRLSNSGWKQVIKTFNEASEKSIAAYGGGNITPNNGSLTSTGINNLTEFYLGHMNSIQIKTPVQDGPAELLSSCNLLLDVDKAKAVGGFDIRFDRTGEDLTLCHRLRDGNHHLWAMAKMDVMHLQDKGFGHWLKKMFRYGQAQPQVAFFYPKHFLGMRGLQYSLVISLATIAMFSFKLAISIFFLYALLVTISFCGKQQKRSLNAIFFTVCTHGFYGAGELWATLTLPFFALKNLPLRMPVLDKRKKKISPGKIRRLGIGRAINRDVERL